MGDVPEVVVGRSCGTCTLCCKVLAIEEVDTPKDSWCQHCEVGRGCRIYNNRPVECANFYCGYLTWDIVPEHWKPDKSKIVIVSELDGARVAFHVDRSRPDAWRAEPFYSEIKNLAEQAVEDDCQIVVCIGYRAIVILPDRDIDLGVIAQDERIVSGCRADGTWDAFKLHKDDPRIADLLPGQSSFRPIDLGLT